MIPKIPRIFRQNVLKFPEFSGSPCKALTSSQMDRKRRRGIRQGGRRAKIGVEPVAFYRDISLKRYLFKFMRLTYKEDLFEAHA